MHRSHPPHGNSFSARPPPCLHFSPSRTPAWLENVKHNRVINLLIRYPCLGLYGACSPIEYFRQGLYAAHKAICNFTFLFPIHQTLISFQWNHRANTEYYTWLNTIRPILLRRRLSQFRWCVCTQKTNCNTSSGTNNQSSVTSFYARREAWHRKTINATCSGLSQTTFSCNHLTQQLSNTHSRATTFSNLFRSDTGMSHFSTNMILKQWI